MPAKTAVRAVYACRRQLPDLAEEELWRTFLEQLTGKRSLREMTEREIGAVIDELRRCGAQPNPRSNKESDKAFVRKVFAIWGDMCRLRHPQQSDARWTPRIRAPHGEYRRSELVELERCA